VFFSYNGLVARLGSRGAFCLGTTNREVDSMELVEVYVNPEDAAVIACPHCGAAVTRYVGKFKGAKRLVKIRCKCQSDFRVSFEFRKARRKETYIQGYYATLADVDNWRKMLITNVSVAGVGLLASTVHNMSEGDQLTVRFSMNGVTRSIVEKDAIVRWVVDGNIGCEFTEPVGFRDTCQDGSLNFFLMPEA